MLDLNKEIPTAHNPIGVSLPGVTKVSQNATQSLLEKNHQKFSGFFNKEGFHNHLSHHVLAAFALGAPPDMLKKIYDSHASYQKPKPPSKTVITKDNWKEHLGDRELWTDYLNFFDGAVKEEGLNGALLMYGLDAVMLPRLVTGALHPIIHVGYGMEFKESIILAEGLASAACHPNRLEKLLDDDFFSFKGDEYITINQIIKDICQDSRFDGILNHEDENKPKKLLKNNIDLVKEYAMKWGIPNSEQGANDRLKELYEACVMAYGSTAQRPDYSTKKLDFFLMHGVTSVLFVKVLFKDLSLFNKINLLRAHFASVLSYYISRGRPKLYPELLYNYTPKEESKESNPWFDVVKKAFNCYEPHVIKTVRSLMKADEEWGGGEHDVFLKVAQLTVDNIKSDNDWSFNGIGFDMEWVDE